MRAAWGVPAAVRGRLRSPHHPLPGCGSPPPRSLDGRSRARLARRPARDCRRAAPACRACASCGWQRPQGTAPACVVWPSGAQVISIAADSTTAPASTTTLQLAQRIDAAGGLHVDLRAVLALALPLVANSAVQTLLNLTDLWF